MTTPTHNTNPDQKFSRDFILDNLQRGATYVRFTKVSNGDDRIMHCTRNPEIIKAFLGEQDESLVTESTRKMNPDSIRAFDLDKKEWRTFNIPTVYHVGAQP